MATIAQIRKAVMAMLQPIQNRLLMIVGRAVLEATKDDEGIQRIKVQLFAGENRDGVERFQNYGLTSHVPPGGECVIVFPGGNRDHGLAISCENRKFRLKNLDEGEVALYTDEGDFIKLRRDNVIEISGSSKVVVKSDNIELGRDALERIVNGETFRTLYNDHTHQGNLGVPTGDPIIKMPLSALSTVTKSKT